MASRAVKELLKFIRRHSFVTIQTPTHVPIILGFGSRHLTDIPMSGDAINACVDMWLVTEVDEIWHQRYRDPFNVFVGFGILIPLLQLGSIRLDIVMTSQAFSFGRQASRLTPIGARMTIDAGDAFLDVGCMVVWKWLWRGGLGYHQPKNSREDENNYNPYPNHNGGAESLQPASQT